MYFFDQELIPYRFSPCSSFCRGDALRKRLRRRRFKQDQDEIWQDCSLSAYASTDRVGFLEK